MKQLPIVRKLVFSEYRHEADPAQKSYVVVLWVANDGTNDYRYVGDVTFSSESTAFSFAMQLLGRQIDKPNGRLSDPVHKGDLYSSIEMAEAIHRPLSSDDYDIRTTCVVKVRDSENVDYFHEQNVECEFTPKGFAAAVTVAENLLREPIPTEKSAADIVGFEWCNRVYRKGLVNLATKHIIGMSIDGFKINYPYDEHEGVDETVDVDYLTHDVHFHYRNILYVVMGQFYMNGEKLFSVKQLPNLIPNYYREGDEHAICMLSAAGCDYFLDWLAGRFPEATGYSCGGTISSLKSRKKIGL